MQALTCLEHVVVEQLGQVGVAPTKLRVRVTENFNNGELLIVPHLGRHGDSMLFHQSQTMVTNTRAHCATRRQPGRP